MTFAVEIPADDHAAALEVLALVTEWKRPAGRDYFMASVTGHPLLEGCKRAFFLKIEPGGNIHHHTDGPAAKAFNSELIVVSTNERCFTCWESSPSGVHALHLELGKRYRLEARDVVHWATNDGDTDRVHLVIEYPKFQ